MGEKLIEMGEKEETIHRIEGIEVELCEDVARIWVRSATGSASDDPWEITAAPPPTKKMPTGPEPALLIYLLSLFIRQKAGHIVRPLSRVLTGERPGPTFALFEFRRGRLFSKWVRGVFNTKICRDAFFVDWLPYDFSLTPDDEYPGREGEKWKEIKCAKPDRPISVWVTKDGERDKFGKPLRSEDLHEIQGWLERYLERYKTDTSPWKQWKLDSGILEATEANPSEIPREQGLYDHWIDRLRSDDFWTEMTATAMNLRLQDSVVDFLKLRRLQPPFDPGLVENYPDRQGQHKSRSENDWTKGKLLESVRESGGGTLVLGEPGSGKSTLVKSLAREMADVPWRGGAASCRLSFSWKNSTAGFATGTSPRS